MFFVRLILIAYLLIFSGAVSIDGDRGSENFALDDFESPFSDIPEELLPKFEEDQENIGLHKLRNATVPFSSPELEIIHRILERVPLIDGYF